MSKFTNEIKDDMYKFLMERHYPNDCISGDCVRAVKVGIKIAYKKLPLNINHTDNLVRDIVQWRLEHRI